MLSQMEKQVLGSKDIEDSLPCSPEILSPSTALYLTGISKLKAEADSARRIPPEERRIINMKYIESMSQERDG